MTQDYLTYHDRQGLPCFVYPLEVDNETFGKRFAAARKASGLSQPQVRELMGKSRVAVSHYEHDRNFPEVAGLIAFARHTGVSLDWLVLGRPPSGQYETRIKDLPEGLRMWMLESLLLAEQVARSMPAEYLQPPKSGGYMAYSQMLLRMKDQLAPKLPTAAASKVDASD